MSDDDAERSPVTVEDASGDSDGVGSFLVGGDGETEPADVKNIRDRYSTSDSEFGVESESVAVLAPEARTHAREAINNEKVSRGALTKATSTQQGPDADLPILVDARREFIEPPYDPRALADLMQKTGTHAQCVNAKAQAVAGHGLSLIPHPEHADTESGEEPEGMERAREFWFGSGTTFQLGPQRQLAPPSEVLENVWTDYESVGWGVLEFLVDATATPTGLAHIPAYRIRQRVDAPGYVELNRYGQIRQYYSAAGLRYDTGNGQQVFIDRWTGETAERAADVSEVANELLYLPNYSPLTPFYGLPDIVPEFQTIVADLAARRYNARFFQNDGVPRFVVSIEGGELTERAFDNLSDNLKDLSKEENTHRGMIVEAINSVEDQESAQNVSVNIQSLTVGEQEDASFIQFRQENEHDIAKVHSVPPVALSRTEDSNYANARQQRQEFAQDTARPKQETFASRLHRTLHAVMLDAPGVAIDFVLRGGENKLREAEIAQTRLDAAKEILTVNEARSELGYEPLTTEDGSTDPVGKMLVTEVTGSTGSGSSEGSGSSADDSDAAPESEGEDTESGRPSGGYPTGEW